MNATLPTRSRTAGLPQWLCSQTRYSRRVDHRGEGDRADGELALLDFDGYRNSASQTRATARRQGPWHSAKRRLRRARAQAIGNKEDDGRQHGAVGRRTRKGNDDAVLCTPA